MSILEEYDLLTLKTNLVKYLDKSGGLSRIEESAKRFKKGSAELENSSFLPIFKITIPLDYVLLAEIAGDYASLLISEPYVAKELLSDVVRSCCIILAQFDQINLFPVVKLTSFPDLSNTVDSTILSSGLFTQYGILCELNTLEKYTQAVLFKCSNCGVQQGSVEHRPASCLTCGSKLEEVARSRLTGERLTGRLLDPKFLNPSSRQARTQGYLVEFRDELCIGLNIGMRYMIALSREAGRLVAWGVSPVLPQPLPGTITALPQSQFSPHISQLITRLREETHGSPWSLVTGLAAHLAASLYPLSAFLHLKTALLLSLASICSRCPVPVLALGDCGNLLTELWECSPRAVIAPTGPTSLLLATHGVCFLQENITLSYITTAIESELVTLKTDKSKESQYSTYPLRSAVWVSWHCNKHSTQDVHKLRTLIEIFGIPFLEEIELNDADISEHLLAKAMNPCRETVTLISKEDFRKFIDVVSRLNVKMSPMASALIRNYFVASRRERPDCLPLKSIKVLTGLSESHARISLRDTVTYEDAVAAIFLYEESIGVLFGPSLFSKQPKRTLESNDPVIIARQMDNVLGRFSLWLSSYTKCQFSSDAASISAINEDIDE